VTVTLRRLHSASEIADLDPATGEFRNFRQAPVDPEVSSEPQTDGWFDLIGMREELVGFYRAPAGHLELSVDRQQIPIGRKTHSIYEPADPGRLPWKLWGTGQRVLRLYEADRLVFEHRYRAESVWMRLADGWGTGTPISQSAYDLLFEVHQLLTKPGERDRVFQAPAHRTEQQSGSAAP
jgi:hypothetical protein